MTSRKFMPRDALSRIHGEYYTAIKNAVSINFSTSYFQIAPMMIGVFS